MLTWDPNLVLRIRWWFCVRGSCHCQRGHILTHDPHRDPHSTRYWVIFIEQCNFHIRAVDNSISVGYKLRARYSLCDLVLQWSLLLFNIPGYSLIYGQRQCYTLPFSFYPPLIHTRFINRWIGLLFMWAVVCVIRTIPVLLFDKLCSSDLLSPTFTDK